MKEPVARLRPSIFMISAMVGLLAVGVVLGFAQGEDSASAKKDRHHNYAELVKAPDKARARSNPLAKDPDAPVAGRKLFEQYCAECHGSSAEGGKKAPSLRAEEVHRATPGTLFWILTNGVVRRGMPVWSKLPEPQRWQLVTYLKTLPSEEGTANSDEPGRPSPPEKPPAKR